MPPFARPACRCMLWNGHAPPLSIGTLIAPPQRLVADRHLEPPEPLRDPQLGGGSQLLAVEESEAERRIDRHARARTAEEPPHRLAQRLPLDVPQREIDRRQRMRGVTG